jgi:hypothetical protein
MGDCVAARRATLVRYLNENVREFVARQVQSFVLRPVAVRGRLKTTEQAGLSSSLLRTRQAMMRP